MHLSKVVPLFLIIILMVSLTGANSSENQESALQRYRRYLGGQYDLKYRPHKNTARDGRRRRLRNQRKRRRHRD